MKLTCLSLNDQNKRQKATGKPRACDATKGRPKRWLETSWRSTWSSLSGAARKFRLDVYPVTSASDSFRCGPSWPGVEYRETPTARPTDDLPGAHAAAGPDTRPRPGRKHYLCGPSVKLPGFTAKNLIDWGYEGGLETLHESEGSVRLTNQTLL